MINKFSPVDVRGINLYQCEFCDYCTARIADFKKHVVIHTGQRPYGCEECGKSYNQSSNLSRHIRLCHRYKHLLAMDIKPLNIFGANTVSYEGFEIMPSFTEIKSSVKEMTPRITEVKSCFSKADFLSTLPSLEMHLVDLSDVSDFHANLPATTDEELLLIDWKLKRDKCYREKLVNKKLLYFDIG
ncbi:hypothetical protein AVEN_258469-1 [Araneus ventricosus]|uniref:C2H2-type domain-containing protein n=1 Tax=Araneus ventricosus TaxID=182803 RepID=A0A4Y2JUW5_ARAVE|nr:hypothetical protein AVEN_258469-1 [Araneus ventricosus]